MSEAQHWENHQRKSLLIIAFSLTFTANYKPLEIRWSYSGVSLAVNFSRFRRQEEIFHVSHLPQHFVAQISLLIHVCLLLIYRKDRSLSCSTDFSMNKPIALFSWEFEQRLMHNRLESHTTAWTWDNYKSHNLWCSSLDSLTSNLWLICKNVFYAPCSLSNKCSWQCALLRLSSVCWEQN